MSKEKAKILIIEDDLDIADMLNAYFRVQGYDVFLSNWGDDGVRAVETVRPDLIILDIRLPDIDGFEVARRLRANRKTNSIPIIFLTERRDRADRLQGLDLGADDYITKPFDVQELRLRVRNLIRRASQDALTNPVTGLPDGDIVYERLQECLTNDSWGLLLISMQNVDDFREKYGFVTSDDTIRAVCLMINNSLRKTNPRENFVGHLSSTDFLLITEPQYINELNERIRSKLEQSLDFFYPLKDRDLPDIKGDRLSVQTAIITPQDGPFQTVEVLKSKIFQRKN